jgi:pimeloyl-ACP methyl ester carboxylesterase
VTFATLYVRLPPGGRAAVAAVTGAFTFFGGVLALDELRWDGASVGDVPRLALLPLGVAALGAAGLALVSRRRVTWPRRLLRWTLTLGVAVLLVLQVVVPGIAAMWLTGKPRIPVRTFAVPHRNVALRTSDGVRLAAWYVPPRNGAAIVLVHGGGGSRDGLKRHATLLARHGYGVLLYDSRGRGDSEGHENGFGWEHERDARAAVDFLDSRGVDRIGILGLSTGAEIAVTEAARDRRIRAVVADGLQARIVSDFAHGGKSDLPYWWVAVHAVGLVRGEQPEPLSRLVPLIKPRPLLIVAGRKDKGDSTYDDVWARSDGRRGVLWKADADHTKALADHPREYERRVVGLFDRALLPTS